jgi:hypothetical protein
MLRGFEGQENREHAWRISGTREQRACLEDFKDKRTESMLRGLQGQENREYA